MYFRSQSKTGRTRLVFMIVQVTALEWRRGTGTREIGKMLGEDEF